jgi:tRNA pseudouridine55 synthase
MADGIVIIDKPAGWTSHDVVARVRRLLNERRVGHTGTLDPFATGVLVVLVGRATRLAQFVSGALKEYEGVVRFGYATDTGDSTGERRGGAHMGAPIEKGLMAWSDEEIERALDGLRGQIEQVPPMYSAKKLKGRKLYEMARRGEEVERAPVKVTIHELEAVPVDGDSLRRNEDGTCDLSVRVVCSAGTYIRTLAESVGERLGVAAHLAGLRRTRAGRFKIEDAKSLDQLSEMVAQGAGASELLLPLEAALSELPFVHLTREEARIVRHGMTLRVEATGKAKYLDGQHVGMFDESGNLLAVGVYDARIMGLHPRVVLSPEK